MCKLVLRKFLVILSKLYITLWKIYFIWFSFLFFLQDDVSLKYYVNSIMKPQTLDMMGNGKPGDIVYVLTSLAEVIHYLSFNPNPS